MEPQATRTTEPRPFLAPEVIARMAANDPMTGDLSVALTAASRLAAKLADVLREGVQDRDFPVLERARATVDAIEEALMAQHIQRARAAAEQIAAFDPWNGCGSPAAMVAAMTRGPLAPHSIAR